MRKLFLLVLAAACLLESAPKKPKLVLFVVIDQCRYDYLTRFRGEYHGGFDRLLKNGAVFANAQTDFFPTLTAVSHATLLSGAMPSASGIMGNDWFDRQAGIHVTSVSDKTTTIVGAPGTVGASPRRLLVTTVGDELRKATGGRSRVIGISIKDRSAILLTGQRANGAYWYDEPSGVFVTSSYYGPELPEWVRSFDESRPSQQYAGVTWLGHKLPDAGKPLYKAIERAPFGNELTEALAERAMRAEKLGQREEPDLLALSFSSTDYVGHDYGPDSPEIHDTLLATDRMLDRLFRAVDREIGLANVLVVMTSDHGVAPLAGVNHARKTPGGHYLLTDVSDAVQAALSTKYGPGKWLAGCWDLLVYLNRDLILERKIDPAEANRLAADAILHMPHMARAYTREQLLDEHAVWDGTGRRMKDGFHTELGADIEFLPEPYWVFSELKTTHGSTYDYDSHVPLIFMGAGIRAARYLAPVRTNDIAPTLAEILGVPPPSGSVGRTLTKILFGN
jgi:hypothetical protein